MKYRVDMAIVRKHCSLSPYIRLVTDEVRHGGGFVEKRDEVGDQAGVYAADTTRYFMGLVWVPTSSLREV